MEGRIPIWALALRRATASTHFPFPAMKFTVLPLIRALGMPICPFPGVLLLPRRQARGRT